MAASARVVGRPASRRGSSFCRCSARRLSSSRARSASRAHAAGAGQARRHPSTVAAACSRPASTPTPSARAVEVAEPGRRAVDKLCAAFARLHSERSASRCSSGSTAAAVRLRAPPGCARRRAARRSSEPRRHLASVKESKRFYPNSELGAHLLGWSVSTTPASADSSPPTTPQIRGKTGTILDSDRRAPSAPSAGSNGRRPPDRPSS